MSWNYRVMAHETVYPNGSTDPVFIIHEVFYENDTDDKPEMYTENGASAVSDTIKGLSWVLKKMQEAVHKPILWAGDRFPQEYKSETQ